MPASEIDRAKAILGRPARLNKSLLAWIVGPNKIDYNYLFLLMIWRRGGMDASRPQRRLRRCLTRTHCPTHGLLIDSYRILCPSFFSNPGIGTKSLYLGAAHSFSFTGFLEVGTAGDQGALTFGEIDLEIFSKEFLDSRCGRSDG